jgi:hypothetical protein
MAVYPDETRYALSYLWLPFLTQKTRIGACRVVMGALDPDVRGTARGLLASVCSSFSFSLSSPGGCFALGLPVGLCPCALRSGSPEYILWRTLGSWARL